MNRTAHVTTGTICLLAAVCMALLASAMAGAQENTTTVEVDANTRAIGAEYYGGGIVVLADGEVCGEISFADGEDSLALGQEQQPDACGRDGATISLQDWRGIVLANTYPLEIGSRIVIDELIVGPVRDESSEPRLTEDGRTSLWIDPVLREGAERYPYFDVYADGELCGRLTLNDAEQATADGGVELTLARADQPEACGREGAAITLVTDSGVRLAQVYPLQPGYQMPVLNFTVPPPGTGGETPAQPDPTREVPNPPDTGTGLMDDGGGARSDAILAALIAGTVALGSAVLLVRNRYKKTPAN